MRTEADESHKGSYFIPLVQPCRRRFGSALARRCDIKTAERSSMNQENLKNLVVWHTMSNHLTCEQLPVMAILKEFREMAGIRGRQAHRGTAPPKYN